MSATNMANTGLSLQCSRMFLPISGASFLVSLSIVQVSIVQTVEAMFPQPRLGLHAVGSRKIGDGGDSLVHPSLSRDSWHRAPVHLRIVLPLEFHHPIQITGQQHLVALLDVGLDGFLVVPVDLLFSHD